MALDLDAFELRATVVNAAGGDRPVVRFALPHDPTERSAVDEVSRAIAEASRAAGTDPDVVHSVCIGIPGYVDPGATGELFSETLPGWPVRGLRSILESELSRTVHIENDVNLAAVAERERGAGADGDVFAVLWLGNGVGAYLRRRGRPCTAAHSAARVRSASCPCRSTPTPSTRARAPRRISSAAAPWPCSARRHGIDARGYHAVQAALGDAGAEDTRRAVFADLAERAAHVALPLLATLEPGRLHAGGADLSLGGSAFADEVGRAIHRMSRWNPDVVATTTSRATPCSSVRASCSPPGSATSSSTRSRASPSPDRGGRPARPRGVGTHPLAVVMSLPVRLRSSGDRAPVSGTVGRGFESLRGHRSESGRCA